MKRVYDLKLIKDYIEGNDIIEYDVDELENDYEFMISVIKYTKDKNMYHLCSDKVKYNYEFVKFMIKKFSQDTDFICTIANNFLNKNKDWLKHIELLLTMRDLTRNKPEKDDNYMFYSAKAAAFYIRKMSEIEMCKDKLKDEPDLIETIGKGFLLVSDEFICSEIVMKYFAQRMVNEILFDTDNNMLEKLIHQEYNSFESLENDGINNYIINIISNYDIELSIYLKQHSYILSYLKKEFIRIKNNWKVFERLDKERRYNSMVQEFHQYMEEYEEECSYYELDILYYIARELGIEEELKEYDWTDEETYQDVLENMNIDKSKMNFLELKHYHNLKGIALSNLKQKQIKLPDKQNQTKTEKVKSKILSIKRIHQK